MLISKQRLSFQKIIQLYCYKPAKVFKIKNKGYIKEGFDADVTIIDMNIRKEVKNNELLTKCGWSPFNGKLLKGWPITTIVNGNVVYSNGNIHDIKAKEVTYHE